MRGPECRTDHRLLRTTLCLRIAPPQPKWPRVSAQASTQWCSNIPAAKTSFKRSWIRNWHNMSPWQAVQLNVQADHHWDSKVNTRPKEKSAPRLNWRKPRRYSLIKEKEGRITSAISWTDHPLSLMLHLTLFHKSQLKKNLTCHPLWKTSSKLSVRWVQRKAPGKDGIPNEIYKAAGPAALEAFHMPQELRDASIVSLFKNKGSMADCGKDHRPEQSDSKHLWSTSPGVTVWVSPWLKYHRHGVCHQKSPGKMLQTEHAPVCSFHLPHLWHHQLSSPMGNTNKTLMPQEVRPEHPSVSRWHDRRNAVWRCHLSCFYITNGIK